MTTTSLTPIPQIADCPLCMSPQQMLNVSLMLYGSEQTALKYKMSPSVGHIGGILHAHWEHLQLAMLLPKVQIPPPPIHADEIVKVQWAIQQMFNLCFSADDTPNIDRTDTDQVFRVIQTKNAVLGNLRETIKLEAELRGTLERGKLRARRMQERDQAHEEDVLPPDERLRLMKADLRRAGYQVTKDTTDTLDVTEEVHGAESEVPPE